MEQVVLDTSILIDYSHGKYDLLDKLFGLQNQQKIELIISTIVYYEFYSAPSLAHPNRLQLADKFFQQFKVLEVNKDIATIAAKFNRLYRLFTKIESTDILIAATCLHLEARLLTRNKRHFSIVPGLEFYAYD